MKDSKDLFSAMLKLGSEWSIESVEFRASDGVVVIGVAHTDWLWINHRCAEDGGKLRIHDRAEERVWRHLNVFQYHCEIRCRLPRGKCETCGKVRVVPAPWEGLCPGFTRAFEAFALLLVRSMSMAEAARILGENDKRLWRLLGRHVDEAMAGRDLSGVKSVGCDELSSRKGHSYLSVFADMDSRTVLFATPGKDGSVWNRFAEDLKAHDGDAAKVAVVSIDMSAAYRLGAREVCPDAVVVFDKFHVIKLANEGVDEVRRKEQRQGTDEAKGQLKGARWLFRKNTANLTDKEFDRFKELDHENLVTAKAYQMRVTLQDIYSKAGYGDDGRGRLLEWCSWVRATAREMPMLAPMARVARTIEECIEGVCANWRTGVTNAFMEGLNSVFSSVKRRARGFRTERNLTLMLYFTAAGLTLPARPHTH
jgi:transposase